MPALTGLGICVQLDNKDFAPAALADLICTSF